MCGQILRSGTAAAANYGEARGAESRADFIHKLKVVFKELNETTIWLEVIVQSGQVSDEAIVASVTENRERRSRLLALQQNDCEAFENGSVGPFGHLKKSIKHRTTAIGQLTFRSPVSRVGNRQAYDRPYRAT